MNVRFVYEPIPVGVAVPAQPTQPSPFSAAWSTTLDDLDREVWMLGARRAVIQLDLERADLRQDGQIRASARLRSGRARLSFESRHGPITMSSGRLTSPNRMPAWQHNLRAIARTLEALRAVERYGAVHTAEQYQGFLALDAAPATGPAFASAAEALAWIRKVTGLADAHYLRPHGAYRAAARRLHPDAGGSREQWDRLEQARQLLTTEGYL